MAARPASAGDVTAAGEAPVLAAGSRSAGEAGGIAAAAAAAAAAGAGAGAGAELVAPATLASCACRLVAAEELALALDVAAWALVKALAPATAEVAPTPVVRSSRRSSRRSGGPRGERGAESVVALGL